MPFENDSYRKPGWTRTNTGSMQRTCSTLLRRMEQDLQQDWLF